MLHFVFANLCLPLRQIEGGQRFHIHAASFLSLAQLLGRHTWFPTLLVHMSILPSFLAFSVYWTTFVVLATTEMTGNIAVISTGDFVQFLV